MKKFALWFPKPMKSFGDPDAETAAVSGQSAYICVVNPFDDGSGQQSLVRSKGRILLLEESISGDECCRQIDTLISDLQKLKVEALKKFKR